MTYPGSVVSPVDSIHVRRTLYSRAVSTGKRQRLILSIPSFAGTVVSKNKLTYFLIRFLFVGSHLAVAWMSPVWAESVAISRQFSVSGEYEPGDRFMGMQLLGTVRLMPKAVNGLKPRELSGLAWDADDELLYAVSDDGFLVHLRVEFRDGVLTRVYLEDAYSLLNRYGGTLSEAYSDAEGLTARHTRNGIPGDAELVVSFEREPRLVRYSPQGQYISCLLYTSDAADE